MNWSSSSWTGRAPRTMAEAFNPYCSNNLHPMPTRSRLSQFFAVYREYRAHHPRSYAAKIAYGIAFKGLPF